MDKHARILVVDDDENIRNSLAPILRAEGYIVDLAANGSEAIQKTKSTTYNAALIDIPASRHGRHRASDENEGYCS